jgi:hypothetical protein
LFSGAIDVMEKADSVLTESWNLKRQNDSVLKEYQVPYPMKLDLTNILERHLKTN